MGTGGLGVAMASSHIDDDIIDSLDSTSNERFCRHFTKRMKDDTIRSGF